jgi:hypothetical protein
VVLPPLQVQINTSQPLSQAINSTVNIINSAAIITTPAKPTGTTASTSTDSTLPVNAQTGDTKKADDKTEEKKDDKKDEATIAKDNGAKKDEPVKKLYCN